jgi:hypothetical protein
VTLSYPAPEPGDIVWCRFPEFEGIHPGPKSRPAFVLAVDDTRKPARVRVAYGTSRGLARVQVWEFVIGPDDGDAYVLSGLSLATKFSLRQVVVLDYTGHWFEPAPGRPPKPTPKLGVLHPSLVRRAQAAHAAATARKHSR